MASHSKFDKQTTATEVAQTFSEHIRGKNVIITGVGPLSLGESMARSIASQKPAMLILASRTKEKIDAVAAGIKESFPDVSVKSIVVNLSSQKSIRQAAEKVKAFAPKIDILINNAAVMMSERQETEDGLELQFGTNHIGPFLFTNLLMDNIRAAAKDSRSTPGSTRIVNVTSAGHRISPIRFSDYNFVGDNDKLPAEEKPASGLPPSFITPGQTYSGFLAYGQCKTGNVLFSLYLTVRLKGQGVTSYSVHPGSIQTDLSRHLGEETRRVIDKTGDFWKNQDQGAATMLVAAFDPALNNSEGVYLSDCQVVPPADHASDPKVAERLWHLSEKLVDQEFDLSVPS